MLGEAGFTGLQDAKGTVTRLDQRDPNRGADQSALSASIGSRAAARTAG